VPAAPGAPADRFAAAVAAIDAANADDPHRLEVRGELRPKEQAHAELMCEWVRRLDPDAGEAQLLAARAHHLRRWTLPRDSQPEGRAGYLRWRAALRRQHARDVAGILEGAGYDTATIERVQQIIRKEGLGTDPEVQTHEDALCLVFLETQLAQTADRLGPDKMRSVAAKTMAKMSPAALGLVADLPLRPQDRALLAEAGDPPSG
jgi:hypothetical protein